MRRVTAFDMPLFFCFLILVGLGIAFVYTSSYPQAMTDGGSGFSFAGKQILFALIGLGLMFACIYIPLPFLRRHAMGIGVIIVGLLVLVLIWGTAKHGNKAWIPVGPFQFQPSEFAKVAIIIILAARLAEHPECMRSFKDLLLGPYLFLGIPLVLIVLQEDLGTATVFALASILLIAIAGAKFRFWGLPVLVLLMLAAMVVLMGHRAERIEAWRHPFNEALQGSYQPRNSLIAIGSGGLFGRGFCQSRQKWFYLPGARNDYIVSIIAEELGLILTFVFLFVPYLFMVYRGFTVANKAPDEFSALVAVGCTVMLATQALVNLGVVTNLLPCMGINLPFISYGGTSLIASMMMAGLLLNVSGRRAIQRQRRHAAVAKQPTAV